MWRAAAGRRPASSGARRATVRARHPPCASRAKQALHTSPHTPLACAPFLRPVLACTGDLLRYAASLLVDDRALYSAILVDDLAALLGGGGGSAAYGGGGGAAYGGRGGHGTDMAFCHTLAVLADCAVSARVPRAQRSAAQRQPSAALAAGGSRAPPWTGLGWAGPPCVGLAGTRFRLGLGCGRPASHRRSHGPAKGFLSHVGRKLKDVLGHAHVTSHAIDRFNRLD